MVHDPCNPVPKADVPKGLPPRHQHVALHVPGHVTRTAARESHAVTAIAPIYVGCDHHTSANAAPRMNAVHFPPAIDVPAAILMPSPTLSVAALASTAPLVAEPGEPDDFSVSMPEPSGATMFLFAVLIVLLARRFNTHHKPQSVRRRPAGLMALKAKRRHRCRSIAPFCALQI